MKDIYTRMWQLAKPYYEKGRVYDIPHIEWFMRHVEAICEKEGLNEALLMPIAILHDVGYSVEGNANPHIKCKASKKMHMHECAKIAGRILEEVQYDTGLSRKIVHYISVHDNWALGDDSPYKECREMAVFNDLDFLYSVSSCEIMEIQAQSMGKSQAEMLDFWIADEKHVRRPFACEYTRKIWDESIKRQKGWTDR
jgi:hypothetical protein